jgi:hypothetical protein
MPHFTAFTGSFSGILTRAAGKSFMAASGGTVTTSGNYKVHVFTTSGSFVVTSPGDCQILVVGGGAVGSGNGGNYTTGGGGAGGLIWTTVTGVSPGTYTATVGAGGTGFLLSSSPRTGNPGNPSSFMSHTAGGGYGGFYGGGGNQGTNDGVAGNTGYAANSGGGGGAGAAATSMNGGPGRLICVLSSKNR